MKNRIFKMIMILCLALGIIFTACACNGGNAETSKPTDKPTDAPTDAPTDKPTDDNGPSTPAFSGYKVTVVDLGGDPLEGAAVQLCTDVGCQLPVLTDANGVALIDSAEDNYTVKVTLEGYEGEPYYTFPTGSKELTVRLYVTPGTSISNPKAFEISDDGVVTPITIEAGATVYYTSRVGGTTMTLTNAGSITVKLDDTTYTPESNTISFEVPNTYSNTNPPVFVITNTGSESATCAVYFVYPEGTMNNPKVVVAGANTASIAADAQAYFLTYTATVNGTVTVAFDEAFTNWNCAVSNLTANIYGQNYSGEEANAPSEITVDVSVGDRVQIVLGVADNTAADITFTFAEAAASN